MPGTKHAMRARMTAIHGLPAKLPAICQSTPPDSAPRLPRRLQIPVELDGTFTSPMRLLRSPRVDRFVRLKTWKHNKEQGCRAPGDTVVLSRLHVRLPGSSSRYFPRRFNL